jgi:serine/threonine protein kinase
VESDSEKKLLADLLLKMLEPDPEKRISPKEALVHPGLVN